MTNVLDPVYRYPLDLTGKSTTNLVSKELHTPDAVDGANEQLVVPLYGGFFSDTVTLRDQNYDLLERGVDYICTYVYEDASLRTGQSVMGAILILVPQTQVYFAGQILGFDFAFSTTVKKDIEAWYAANLNTRPKEGGIVGKAQVFTEGAFRQQLWSFDGYEPTAAEMERISRELLLGDLEGLDALSKHVDTNNASTGQGTENQLKKLNDHIANTSNPHNTTPAQLNLDTRLKNLSESPVEVNASSDDTIALPDTLRSVIDQVFGTELDDHRNNTNNPHKLHIHQIGGYTKDEIRTKLATRLPINTTAISTGLVDGRTETTLSTDTNAFFNAGNFTNGRLSLSTMGLDTPSSETVLMGNSKWRSLSSIFNEYDKPAMKIYFEGTLGPDSEAIAYIRTKYNDINAYPDGTLVIWNYNGELVMWNGNDQTQQQVNPLTRCARRIGYNWDFDFNWQNSYYSATNYLNGSPGENTISLAPGTYSVIIVGGGGGGNGTWNRGCGGGGSGYMTKGRITVKWGDVIHYRVGGGGQPSQYTGDSGQQSYLDLNGNRVLTANGGLGATKMWNDEWFGQGGNGASGGGGSSGRWEHGRHDFHPSSAGGGGTNGGNGGWSWDQQAERDFVPGGSGAGSNYYTKVMNSIDSNINHGFPQMGAGGPGLSYGNGQKNGTLLTVRGGGGGGVGTQRFGEWFNWKGSWCHCTGYGHGAGGGGMQRGIAGVISFVRIRHY